MYMTLELKEMKWILYKFEQFSLFSIIWSPSTGYNSQRYSSLSSMNAIPPILLFKISNITSSNDGNSFLTNIISCHTVKVLETHFDTKKSNRISNNKKLTTFIDIREYS